MRAEDVYQLTGVSDPRLRPGGEEVAYVVWAIDGDENEYRQSIWLARTDGSEPPRRFTTGKNDAQPRWSPDGDRLAFVSKRGDDEKAHRQLYVLPAGGGEPECLTDLKEDVGEPVWSPDGTRIVFSARVPDEAYDEEDEKKRAPRRFKRLQFKLDSVGWTGDRRRHLYVVPADGSAATAKQITDGDFEDSRPTWTPDGKSIAFSSARGEHWDIELIGDIYVVPAEGGEPKRLTPGDSSYYAPSYSPDGKLLAVKWDPGGFDFPRHPQIAVVDAETGENRRILTASLDRTCDPYPEIREPIWDGDSIVFAIEDRGNVHIYRVAAGGRRARAPDRRATSSSPATTRATGRSSAPARRRRTCPSSTSGDRQLTDIGSDFAAGRELVAPERFTADLEGRHRGGGLDRPARRPGGGQALPGDPEHPRRAVHPVRQRLLRRDAGLRRRRVRRPLLEPTRLVRLLRGVGARDHGAGRARAGLGHRRLRGPDGGRRHGARALRLPRPGAARRHRRVVRRLHDLLDRLAHEPLQGGLLRARGQQHGLDVRLERHRLGLQGLPRRASCTTTSRRTWRCRRGRTRSRSRRRS